MGIFVSGSKEISVIRRELDLFQRDLAEMDAKLTKLERTFPDLLEEINARVDRGNKIWRGIRRRERAEEGMGEEGDEGPYHREQLQLPIGDGRGGPAEGVPTLREAVAGADQRPYHEIVADELARSIINST